jgi:hypothetical protein
MPSTALPCDMEWSSTEDGELVDDCSKDTVACSLSELHSPSIHEGFCNMDAEDWIAGWENLPSAFEVSSPSKARSTTSPPYQDQGNSKHPICLHKTDRQHMGVNIVESLSASPDADSPSVHSEPSGVPQTPQEVCSTDSANGFPAEALGLPQEPPAQGNTSGSSTSCEMSAFKERQQSDGSIGAFNSSSSPKCGNQIQEVAHSPTDSELTPPPSPSWSGWLLESPPASNSAKASDKPPEFGIPSRLDGEYCRVLMEHLFQSKGAELDKEKWESVERAQEFLSTDKGKSELSWYSS